MAQTLTDKESRTLRAFQRQVDRLRDSSLNPSGPLTMKTSVSLSLDTGKVETQFEAYDKTKFQAQLPILRQFILQDVVNFNHVHNLIEKYCDRTELKEWNRLTRQKWIEALKGMPIESHQYFHGATQTVEQAVESLFYGYGGLFHVDMDKPPESETEREIRETTVQNAFPDLWTCLHNMHAVINLWLDEPTREVPPLPTH